MPKLFRLESKEFSKVDNEWQWTYICQFNFTFKRRIIEKITITNHYQQEHPTISNELILNILKAKINGIKRMRVDKKYGNRDIFVRRKIPFDGKKYKLIFWFKDHTNNHLWIRNCHEQDYKFGFFSETSLK